jgi:hypothetical protein
MQENLKIILLCGLILSLILLVVGVVGTVLGHIIFSVPLIFGAGAALPYAIELAPLFKQDKNNDNKE